MNRELVIQRLLELPERISWAEEELIQLNDDLRIAKEALTDKESELLFAVKEDGKKVIDGKNAEERTAQMRGLTQLERADIFEAEVSVSQARLELTRLQNEFKALRSISFLLHESKVGA